MVKVKLMRIPTIVAGRITLKDLTAALHNPMIVYYKIHSLHILFLQNLSFI
jgi:hypothetical protein